jgi:hypothetical protein
MRIARNDSGKACPRIASKFVVASSLRSSSFLKHVIEMQMTFLDFQCALKKLIQAHLELLLATRDGCDPRMTREKDCLFSQKRPCLPA